MSTEKFLSRSKRVMIYGQITGSCRIIVFKKRYANSVFRWMTAPSKLRAYNTQAVSLAEVKRLQKNDLVMIKLAC